jgi:hypothetical protein
MKLAALFVNFSVSAVLSMTLCLPLGAADAPTAEEWTPVETALNSDAPDAEMKLSTLIRKYPKWADGQRTLAQWRMEHGKAEQALADARTALNLAPTDSVAASLAVQANGKLNRPAEAYKIAERFVGDKDPEGWVNFRAAEVALAAGDRKKAEMFLGLALSRNKNPPGDFSFLDARISEFAGDLDRAEIALNRAIAAKPRFWTAIYQLGVVNYRQAEKKTASSRREYLKKAEANFLSVTNVNRKDAQAWLAQGRAQITLAQELLLDDTTSGKAKAREAEHSLLSALTLDEKLRDAHVNAGVAMLINDKHDDAIMHLQRARALGDTSRTVGFNLMLAYQKAGRTADFEQEARQSKAVSTAEKLTAGIGFYKAGNYAMAAELLTSAIPELGEDRTLLSSVHRYIGHAHAGLAASVTNELADSTRDSTKDQEKTAAREKYLDDAREAYRKAGNLQDYVAQRFFTGQETQRSALLAYEAGWQLLRWSDNQSLAGWFLVVGNYGSAVTGEQGLGGILRRNPMHLFAWILAALIPLGLGIYAWMRPRPVREESPRPAPRPVAHSSLAPVTKTPVPDSRTNFATNSSPTAIKTALKTPLPQKTQLPNKTPLPKAPTPAARPVPSHPTDDKLRTPKPQTRAQADSDSWMEPVRSEPSRTKNKARSNERDETEPVLKMLPDTRAPDRKQARKSSDSIPAPQRDSDALERKVTDPSPPLSKNNALERRTPRPRDH